jgi:hypothetical protein
MASKEDADAEIYKNVVGGKLSLKGIDFSSKKKKKSKKDKRERDEEREDVPRRVAQRSETAEEESRPEVK